MGMSDVNGYEILSALDEPVDEFLPMFNGQKRIDKDGIAFTMNQCDAICRELLHRGCRGRGLPLLKPELHHFYSPLPLHPIPHSQISTNWSTDTAVETIF